MDKDTDISGYTGLLSVTPEVGQMVPDIIIHRDIQEMTQ